jgi:arginase
MNDTPSALTTSSTLRLVWPQWQGAGAESVAQFVPELPLQEAHRGTATGTAVLQAILPPHDGPTAVVPTELGEEGLEQRDGIYAKSAVIRQLRSALEIINEHDIERIVTLGGDCSVSVAPFSSLAARYGKDLAIVWIDSHPDVGTPKSAYPGYQAMGVAVLTGHGDQDIIGPLPATVPGTRIALAGMHSWFDEDPTNIADWGISTFSPDALRSSSAPLLEWIASTGCSRVAVHLDVDTVDSNEVVLGLAPEPGGLTSEQVRRLISDIGGAADVVGFTIAEYIPRQVIALQRLLRGLPLL